MRKAFDRQRRLDCPSVTKVSLNINCRNETIPILRALQHIYSTPKVRDSILRAIAGDVNGKTSAKHGRPGLSYWEILVLAAARLGCGYDYDQLQDLAENHRALRQVMGIGDWESEEKDRTRFDWRRIESNVDLLHPETVEQINQAITAEGHRLEPKAAQSVRGDSFVVETNIHYPTDSSLIADGLRKVLGLAVMLAGMFGLIGWRQHKHLSRKARKLVRRIDRVAARKGNGYQERLKQPYRELLEVADLLLTRAETLRETVQKYGTFTSAETLALDKELETFVRRTRHVCDLARRRVLQGETIPHSEKLFSIFETHTQLYKRGKAGEPIQFGRLVLVFEDGAGFITHYHLLSRDQDDWPATRATATWSLPRHARPRNTTGARSAEGRSTAAFTAPQSKTSWPRSSNILVSRCRGASKRPDSLANYFGLTPGCRNSGEATKRLGSITKQGSRIVRYLLNQAVVRVLRFDGTMRTWFKRIKKRRGSKIARVAVMRRLVTILWHMLKRKQKYRYDGPVKKHPEFERFEGQTEAA